MPNPAGDSARSTLQAHALMRQTGEVPAGRVPAVIETSWRRCLEAGLEWGNAPDFDPLRRDALETMRERDADLISHARPVMETLHEQIANTQSMVVLSDASGYILHSLGDNDFLARAQTVALAPGVGWSEGGKGTNAIGTALAERAPVVVHGPQHYLALNHILTCSAAPILDPYGQPVGVLDVTGDRRGFSPHTLALVNMSVGMIENHLFADTFGGGALLRFHARPEFLGTLCEGMAAFGEDGRLLSANRSGCFQLGLSRAALHGQAFEAIFGLAFGVAVGLASMVAPDPIPLVLHNGIRVFARLELAERRRATAHAAPPASLSTGFFAEDPRLAALLQQAVQALGRGLPLLLQGETGSGKTELARWVHGNLTERGPRVDVHCGRLAAEELDALVRRWDSGRPARGPQALLFLRDVDALGPPLQARLVTALNAGLPLQAGPGGARVVSTSRSKLKELVARGRFREDLYYRLCGLALTLPPLRERRDTWALACWLAERRCEGPWGLRLDEGLRPLLEAHPWPGNLRQMIHVLRAAAAQAGPDHIVRPPHLPEDFLAEIGPPGDGNGAGNLHAIARQAIEAALHAHRGNISAAARSLGISRSTLYRRMREN